MNHLCLFSLETIMSDVESIAPTLCMILHQVSMPQSSDQDVIGRFCMDGGLVCQRLIIIIIIFNLLEFDCLQSSCDCFMHAHTDLKQKFK